MSKQTTFMQLGENLTENDTNLNRLQSMSDDDIDCSDIPELDQTFWQNAKLVMPTHKKQLTIRVDDDVLTWFKSQGKGYQTHINNVLRSYYEIQHKNA